MVNNSFLKGDRTFHQNTRFPLTGKHLKQSCDSCHLVKGKSVYKFPNAKKDFCVNCHTNVHKKQFSSKFYNKSCADCHTTNDFVKRKPFNHNSTDFKLTGRHQAIKNNCLECHVKTNRKLPTKPPKIAHKFKFAGKNLVSARTVIPTSIVICLVGSSIRSHAETATGRLIGPKRKKFDHNQTAFRLRYKHKKVECNECHVPTRKRFKQGPGSRKGLFDFPELKTKNCQTCHRDPHKGANGQLARSVTQKLDGIRLRIFIVTSR